MKKIALLLLLAPLSLFAQSGNHPVVIGSPMKSAVIAREGYQSPVQIQHQAQAGTPIGRRAKPAPPVAAGYKPSVVDTIGLTTYDLQTNGSLAKRLQLYPSVNKMSYVWIYSPQPPDDAFTTRYSGYNTFDGTSWVSPYTTSFKQYEFDRSGWPSIGAVTTGSSTYELMTSHYAAAASTTYSGGLYWYTNSGIGNTDFKQIIDKSSNHDSTTGLLWPRMATSGNRVYIIGTFQDDRTIKGVINPVVYYCYNTSTSRFETKGITLPGYDSTRYGSGSADIYSIDARDSFVAILIGGDNQSPGDLALWKSTDSGKTFKKTIIDSFANAPWSFKVDQTITDTTLTNDGTGSVTLDGHGVAHVSYSPWLITNTNPVPADSGVESFIQNDGIIYWNDKDKQKIKVGGCIDYEKQGDSTLVSNLDAEDKDEKEAGYGHNLACYSNIAVDPQGNIYVVFSAPHEDDLYSGSFISGACFRHVYCSVYNAAQDAWLPQQDIVQTWNVENVFATVARDADSKLRLVYMQDDVPGFYLPGGFNAANQSVTTDTLIYEEVSTADLLGGKVGLIDLGVDQKIANNIFSTGSIYPNPTADKLNLSLNLTRSATVSVKLFNMLGEQIEAQDYTMLPSGKNNLQLGVSNLPAGVYLCNISAGGYTTTERVVVER